MALSLCDKTWGSAKAVGGRLNINGPNCACSLVTKMVDCFRLSPNWPGCSQREVYRNRPADWAVEIGLAVTTGRGEPLINYVKMTTEVGRRCR